MLFTEHSPWLILPGIFLGAIYALLLYRKKNPWGKKTTIILAVTRFILVTALYLLLLDPLARQISRHKEKPVVIVALDNSLSVKSVIDDQSRLKITDDLKNMQGALAGNDMAVRFMDLSGKEFADINSIPFNVTQTDFSELFNNIDNAYEGRNISGVILASDGIYNSGVSPLYRNYSYPVITVGLGDTLQKDDISIRAIYNNRIVYQGNRFMMNVEIFNYGYLHQAATLEILHNGKSVASSQVQFSSGRGLQQVSLTLDADKSGTQRYTAFIKPLLKEQTENNNRRETYIEVIEAREKILLLAHSPHPDIKALRSVIEKNQNYELTVLTPDEGKFKPDKYNLVIYHQVPDSKGSFEKIIRDNHLNDLPALYIIGAKTNLNSLGSRLGWLKINPLSTRADNAFPVVNNSFSGFIISEEEKEALAKFPPLSVPFGEYITGNTVETGLFQKIENVLTSRPLLAIAKQGEIKTAVITGEGIWRWRLNEFLEKNSHSSFDSFILKLIQLTSSREDRRKFRVYPVKNDFWDDETVEFETEAYNDIFERVYGQDVSLSVTSENGAKTDYSYITSETSSRFRISGMEAGVYNFSARATLDGTAYKSNGVFTIKRQQVESINLAADFDLLRKLADKTSGYFVSREQIKTIPGLPALKNSRPVIYSSESISALINLKWIFFVLLTLVTTEWVIRKYLGGY
jgi:hypothetical protein